MKRATWLRVVAALSYAFVLAQLSGCGIGSGTGQVTPPTPTPNPVSRSVPAVPAALPTSESNVPVPPPVISVYPPANSLTAIVYATAGAQRTATALSYNASSAATITAIAKAAPTYAAQQTVQAATWDAALHPTPQSAHVERGKAYPFLLSTHCGVDNYTDFDGSFWDLLQTNYAPGSLGNPAQRGTMTLTKDDHAMFEFDGGSIHFTRHLGPKVLAGMCG